MWQAKLKIGIKIRNCEKPKLTDYSISTSASGENKTRQTFFKAITMKQ